MALVDGQPRSADARALSDIVLGFLPLNRFNEIIEARSDLSYRLMSSVCIGLLGHIRLLDNTYLQAKTIISNNLH
jgi:CRP-like cAMP-binding protein